MKSPRKTIQTAFQIQLITDGHTWIDALEKRNLMAHTYDEKRAMEVEKLIREKYYKIIKELYFKLALHAMLEEKGPLPYFFDIVDYTHLSHKGLKEHIDRVGKVIYEKGKK
ncbi:MAG: hypothetical protein PWQ82_1289 [Thermosediminibacterales bacterium]|nr:hypothetical protein [Thermosediminibacterales bacterium]MDK2836509.1 hypothetical protein [Thermosediminibacterales bacterium]